MGMRVKNEDAFGFEIKGILTAETKEEKIECYEAHLLLLEGLTNEAISDIENRISKLKYDN